MQFVLNSIATEVARKASEAVMNAQKGGMEQTKNTYESMASSLDSQAASLEAQAAAQDVIASSAMKTEYYYDSDGDSHSRQVPDTAARAAAAANAAALRAQAGAKRSQAASLRGAAGNLGAAIGVIVVQIAETNRQVAQLQADIQAADQLYNQKMEATKAATDNYISKMKDIFDSFNDTFPLTSGDVNTLHNINGKQVSTAQLVAQKNAAIVSGLSKTANVQIIAALAGIVAGQAQLDGKGKIDYNTAMLVFQTSVSVGLNLSAEASGEIAKELGLMDKIKGHLTKAQQITLKTQFSDLNNRMIDRQEREKSLEFLWNPLYNIKNGVSALNDGIEIFMPNLTALRAIKADLIDAGVDWAKQGESFFDTTAGKVTTGLLFPPISMLNDAHNDLVKLTKGKDASNNNGVLKGFFIDSPLEAIRAGLQMLTNPAKVLEGLLSITSEPLLYLNPGKLIGDNVSQEIEYMIQAEPEEQARWIGKLFGDITIAIVEAAAVSSITSTPAASVIDDFDELDDLHKVINPVDDLDDWNKQFEKWVDGLSDAEVHLIENYSGDDYKLFNGYLRGEDVKLTVDQLQAVEDLKTVLSKSPLPNDVIVYRGTGDDVLTKMFDIDDLSSESLQKLAGQSYTEKGFLSTDIYETSNFSSYSDVKWEITVLEGTEAGYIKSMSVHSSSESELLINAGQNITISTVEQTGEQIVIKAILGKGE